MPVTAVVAVDGVKHKITGNTCWLVSLISRFFQGETIDAVQNVLPAHGHVFVTGKYAACELPVGCTSFVVLGQMPAPFVIRRR